MWLSLNNDFAAKTLLTVANTDKIKAIFKSLYNVVIT